MANWTTQIKKFVNSTRKILKVECYHGDSREEMLELLAANKLDVLVTSYNTLASDYKKREEYESEQAEEQQRMDNEEQEEEAQQLQQQKSRERIVQPMSTSSTSIQRDGARAKNDRQNYSEDSSIDSMEDDDDESATSWSDNDDGDDDSLDEGEPTFIFDHSFHRIILDGTYCDFFVDWFS